MMVAFSKWFLGSTQLVGIFLSGALITAIWTNPHLVESKLREAAIAKVESRIAAALDERADASEEGFVAFGKILGDAAERIEAARPEITRALVALSQSETCQVNCEFWTVAALAIDATLLSRVSQLKIGRQNLQEFASDRYDRAVEGLKADLLRFGFVTIVALSLMLALTLLRERLNWRFAAFSAAVTIYVGWAAYGYLFDQNWAMAIILNDWAAPGYQMMMIVMSCLFADWLFLRGRITNAIANAIATIVPG